MKRFAICLSLALAFAVSAGPLLLQPSGTWFRNLHNGLFTTAGYVDCGNTFDKAHTDAWSATGWIKLTSTATQMHLLRKAEANNPTPASYRGYQVFRQNSGEIVVFLINTYPINIIYITTTTAVLNDTNPHHWALTVDGTSTAAGVKLYIDGAAKAKTVTADTLSATISTTAPLTIGTDADNIKNLAASYDELTLWNRALTQAEVTTLYNSGRVVPAQRVADYATSAVSSYRFEGSLSPADAYNTTIYDRKGSNNCTPTGAAAGFIATNVFL